MKLQELKKYNLFKNEKLLNLELLKTQGLCNTIYKLQTSKKEYLLRVFKHTHQDKHSRKNEFKIQKKAYKKDIASKAYILDEKNSLMICNFLEGSHKETLKKNDIKALVKALKKLHKIKINKKPYDLKKDFKNYEKNLENKEVRTLVKSSLKELKKLKKYKFEAVLSHHDLNQQNILFYKNKVRFIDWEFACINDRFFDIANICIEFNLNKKQERQVLKSYFTRIKPKHTLKLTSYKIIYTNLWKLWFLNYKK